MFNSSYYGGILPSTGTGLVLSVIAFIAAIVVTVLLYMKYISEGKVTTQATKHDWGPFFRFESLIIEKILKVLYLFTTCLIAFEAIASIIASFTYYYRLCTRNGYHGNNYYSYCLCPS